MNDLDFPTLLMSFTSQMYRLVVVDGAQYGILLIHR